MSISVEGARAYFKTRTAGDAWNEYSTEQKEAAIAQARRDLSRSLGRPLRENEPPYHEGDRTRDEFAVYEQALYTLLRDTAPKGGSGSAIPSINQGETTVKARTLRTGEGKWSMEALSWLAKRITTEVVVV